MLNKFVYFIVVCFLKLKPAVLFFYTVKGRVFEKAKVRPGPSLMQPAPHSYWPDRKLRLGVALAEGPASSEAKGGEHVRAAASITPGLGLGPPSTLFCLPHPFVMYAILI